MRIGSNDVDSLSLHLLDGVTEMIALVQVLSLVCDSRRDGLSLSPFLGTNLLPNE